MSTCVLVQLDLPPTSSSIAVSSHNLVVGRRNMVRKKGTMGSWKRDCLIILEAKTEPSYSRACFIYLLLCVPAFQKIWSVLFYSDDGGQAVSFGTIMGEKREEDKEKYYQNEKLKMGEIKFQFWIILGKEEKKRWGDGWIHETQKNQMVFRFRRGFDFQVARGE